MTVITRINLTHWLDESAKNFNLVAPKDVSGVLLYRPVSSSKEIIWEFGRPVLSAKDVIFPSTDHLFSINKSGQNIHLSDFPPGRRNMIFGIRPCDARGIAGLDALFMEDSPVDPYYAGRRQNSVLIGIACQEMGESCFCTSMGSAPDDPAGMDILLTSRDGDYEVTVVTERGLNLVKYEWGLRDAEISPHRILEPSPSGLPAMDSWPSFFNDHFWEEIAERCLSCRICAFVCPVCRCFDVRDERVSGNHGNQKYDRIRCWDSCAGDGYRRIAGGHNPRSEKSQRIRNRFFCKFYYYPEQYGPVACTGCGRCIDSCPVNIDITEVLEHIRSAAQQNELQGN